MQTGDMQMAARHQPRVQPAEMHVLFVFPEFRYWQLFQASDLPSHLDELWPFLKREVGFAEHVKFRRFVQRYLSVPPEGPPMTTIEDDHELHMMSQADGSKRIRESEIYVCTSTIEGEVNDNGAATARRPAKGCDPYSVRDAYVKFFNVAFERVDDQQRRRNLQSPLVCFACGLERGYDLISSSDYRMKYHIEVLGRAVERRRLKERSNQSLSDITTIPKALLEFITNTFEDEEDLGRLKSLALVMINESSSFITLLRAVPGADKRFQHNLNVLEHESLALEATEGWPKWSDAEVIVDEAGGMTEYFLVPRFYGR